MKKTVLLLLVLSFRLISQDTIRFNNGDVKAVKVSEVGINEVKYNRFDNLTGPTYISSKSEIKFIKYSSGHTDTFTEEKPQTPVVQNPPTDPNPNVTYISPSVNVLEVNDVIEVRRKRVTYHGHLLGEHKLMKLIVAYPNTKTGNIMLNEFKTMKSYKSQQYLFGFLGLGLGLGSVVGGIAYGAVYKDINGLWGFPIGAVIGTAGAIISGVFKSKRHQKMMEIAEIYNKGK